MGEIHELFLLTLSLVWFAGATPDFCLGDTRHSLHFRRFFWGGARGEKPLFFFGG